MEIKAMGWRKSPTLRVLMEQQCFVADILFWFAERTNHVRIAANEIYTIIQNSSSYDASNGCMPLIPLEVLIPEYPRKI